MAIARMYVIKKDSTVLILDESCEVIDSFIADRNITYHEGWVVRNSGKHSPPVVFFRCDFAPYIVVQKSDISIQVVEDVFDGFSMPTYHQKQLTKLLQTKKLNEEVTGTK